MSYELYGLGTCSCTTQTWHDGNIQLPSHWFLDSQMNIHVARSISTVQTRNMETCKTYAIWWKHTVAIALISTLSNDKHTYMSISTFEQDAFGNIHSIWTVSPRVLLLQTNIMNLQLWTRYMSICIIYEPYTPRTILCTTNICICQHVCAHERRVRAREFRTG